MAVLFSVVLHAGLVAAWAMQSPSLVSVPDQQVIKISMVAASKPMQPIQATPAVKAESIMTVTAAPKPLETAARMVKKQPSIREQENLQPEAGKPTVGLQHKDAEQTESAITKPIAANYLNNPQPHYPLRARKNGYQGTVLLDVAVQTNGKPRSIRLARSSGYDILDDIALETVRQWEFIPARQGRELIEASVEVPIKFQMN